MQTVWVARPRTPAAPKQINFVGDELPIKAVERALALNSAKHVTNDGRAIVCPENIDVGMLRAFATGQVRSVAS
jgi:hypothetical protein